VAESNKETTAQPQSATAESAEATASEAAKSEEPEEQGKPEPIAGYNMIEKDGRWLYCHKVKAAAGTGSRLSPVTECHTADQVAVEQKALKK
jgi:nitrate reductase cytochrome c-type subunit